MKIVSQADARGLFEYDARTGALIWKYRPLHHFKDASYQLRWNKRCAGRAAGSVSGLSPYIRVNVSRTFYLAHRIVWLHVNGHWPSGQIDHINGVKTDNRLANLRQVNRLENARNAALPCTNTSGVVGVSYDNRDDLWHAYIGVGDGSRKSLGYFKTKAEAAAARLAGERLLGYHKNHGRAA